MEFIITCDQFGNCALASPGMPNKCHILARLDIQAKIPQDRLAMIILKSDAVELNPPRQVCLTSVLSDLPITVFSASIKAKMRSAALKPC